MKEVYLVVVTYKGSDIISSVVFSNRAAALRQAEYMASKSAEIIKQIAVRKETVFEMIITTSEYNCCSPLIKLEY